MLLRCIEDDVRPTSPEADPASVMSFSNQVMLSELWVGGVYEIIRLLVERKLAPDTPLFRQLAHELRLLRIPLEKHEIAADKKLTGPLQMTKSPPNGDASDTYTYSKDDYLRSHIMRTGVSERGSQMWEVTDVVQNASYWLERRALSDRMMSIWKPDKKSP